jgi:DNA-binding NarL/FixJ family response regulator
VHDHRPHLIILDLNLPGRSGHDFLVELKSSPATQQIPVVVLSTSESPGDVDRAYRSFAACYLVKPESFATLVELMRDLSRFWFAKVKLP